MAKKTRAFRPIFLMVSALFVSMIPLGIAHAGYIGNLELEHPSHSFLANGMEAGVTFAYKISHEAGASFRVDPYYNGSVVPGATRPFSTIRPQGSGTYSSWFKFTSGSHTVDQYRVAMIAGDTGELLLEIFLPAHYVVGDNGIFNISHSTTLPAWMGFSQHFTVNFDYQTSETEGVMISVRPYTDGSLTPGYSASGMTLLPYPTGSYSQWFTFNSTEAEITHLRFAMYNADQSATLLEFFVPAHIYYGPNGVSNISISPSAPDQLENGQMVTVEFDYYTSDPDGCRVWAYGTDDDHYLWLEGEVYDGSPVLAGPSGHVTRRFWFQDGGEHEVTRVMIRMLDGLNQDTLLLSPVKASFIWAPNIINSISYAPAAPAVLDPGEFVFINLHYVTDYGDIVRVRTFPHTDGVLTHNGSYIGSPPLSEPQGTLLRGLSVLEGPEVVEETLFSIRNDAGSLIILEFPRPTQYFFGTSGTVVAAPDIPSIGKVTLGQNYPNPFNPNTIIPFYTPDTRRIRLDLYDPKGRLVRRIADGIFEAGSHKVLLDCSELSSGMYFVRLKGQDQALSKKIILLK